MKQATNLYEQIYSFYKNLIYRGVIRKDEYLPSVREVALARKINPNTVVKAYSLLINDGLITSINKKGYLVIYSNEDKATTLPLSREYDLILDAECSNRCARRPTASADRDPPQWHR